MVKAPITVRIEPSVWKEVKKIVIDLNMTAGRFVETAILHEIRRLQSYTTKSKKGSNKVSKRK